MALLPVPGSTTNHTTACPFEMPDASGVVASSALTAEGTAVPTELSVNGDRKS
jgi:hypothetical protein